ncbi:PTS sugar transporter subunit IIA [Fluviibacterium sp. DFM31]|uniref:PTS sugar transporter subunit IIA n=1 Tax=Meridianimarinicoccus marinus TaxID=3231483 RepID=A0ABV3L9M3_9RHOB
MTLGSLLNPEAVKVVAGMSSKKKLLRDLSDLSASVYGLCPDDAVDALLDRESIGPTGVGGGIALPHARMDGLDKVVGAFMKLERPLPFDSVDHQPVDLVFALFAPENSGVQHLKALAVVSRALRNPKIQAQLRANDDPSILYTILAGAEESKAA